MAKSIALAADPSQLASLLLSYIPAVCAFVAPRHPGASAAIIDRLSHSRALRETAARHRRAFDGDALGSRRLYRYGEREQRARERQRNAERKAHVKQAQGGERQRGLERLVDQAHWQDHDH